MAETSLYRPFIHFCAQKGWINDPNGLVFADGKYHLFHQYYPNATHWGPMHWGHAVSEDLLHWEYLPVALVPDDLGVIFSGSAVMDTENVSGFGDGEHVPMVVCYTNHNLTSKKEEQSIAYSTDYVHFTKYAGNPVIRGLPGENCRDPKLFRNPVRGGYSLALATGESVSFYASRDLKSWEKTGEFEAGEHGISGICECPDCFPVETPEGTKWVLIVSMIVDPGTLDDPVTPYNRMSHITQYYVGEFDGDRFIDTQKADRPLLVDYGTDNYAAVTFSGLPETVMMAWADNWDYANQSPAAEDGFQGKMTLGRRLGLVRKNGLYLLRSEFCGLDEARRKAASIACRDGASTGLPIGCAIGLQAEIPDGGGIRFVNGFGEALHIFVQGGELIIDRTGAGRSDFSEKFASDRTGILRIPREQGGTVRMEIVLDRCLMELIADDGLLCASVGMYPRGAYDRMFFDGAARGRMYAITV